MIVEVKFPVIMLHHFKEDSLNLSIEQTNTHAANGPWKKKFELYFPY